MPPERIRDDASRAQWAPGEGRRLIAFARGSRHRDGFGWLDEDGRFDPDRPVETSITARITYVFCLAHVLGDDVVELIDHGLKSMSTVLHDEQFGGWVPLDPARGPQEGLRPRVRGAGRCHRGDGWSPGRSRCGTARPAGGERSGKSLTRGSGGIPPHVD